MNNGIKIGLSLLLVIGFIGITLPMDTLGAIPSGNDFEGLPLGEDFVNVMPDWSYYSNSDDTSLVVANTLAKSGTRHILGDIPEIDYSGTKALAVNFDTTSLLYDDLNPIISWGMGYVIDGDTKEYDDTNTTLTFGIENDNWWYQLTVDGYYIYDAYGGIIYEFEPALPLRNYSFDWEKYVWFGMAINDKGYYQLYYKMYGSQAIEYLSGWKHALNGGSPFEGIWFIYSSTYSDVFTSEPIPPLYVDDLFVYDDDAGLFYGTYENLRDLNDEVIVEQEATQDGRVDGWMFAFIITGGVLLWTWFVSTQIDKVDENRFLYFFKVDNEYYSRYAPYVATAIILLGIAQYLWGWIP